MDYSTYTACLSAYHRLEQSDDKKLYTRRYRQFLLQVFSADSVLQLVPNAAIQLLQKYSEGCPPDPDRKSTRLNSSHVAISYAVFCLKKKNNGKILLSGVRIQ